MYKKYSVVEKRRKKKIQTSFERLHLIVEKKGLVLNQLIPHPVN
jgi:hypothetical protein